MRVPRENTAALIIDIQERLFPHIHDHEALAGCTEILVKGLQVLGIPLAVTQQYTRGLGPTVEPVASLFRDFSPIEKTAFSCCDEPAVIKHMIEAGRDFLLLAGIETHVCILQTAVDLLERGYQPVVIEDCVGSRRNQDKVTALERMRKEGAILSSCESILFELCRFSGTDEFRAISALVK